MHEVAVGTVAPFSRLHELRYRDYAEKCTDDLKLLLIV